jgi:nucleotide-binding universal stress UspA family protein
MFGRMILGYDGTAQSGDALALARLLASSQSRASVVISHVVPHPPPFDARTREYVKRLQQHVRAVLDPAVAALSGLTAEARPLESSSTARGLHELADEEGASLIVIGSTRRGPVGRVVIGSVGEILLAGSPTAVAVAPKGYADVAPGSVGVVGAGFNASAEGRVALRAASALAAQAGARLRAIAVEEGFAHARHPLKPVQRDKSALEEDLDRALEEVGAPDAERMVLKGGAVQCLCEAGAETDLLVIGSRGYGPVQHALVGSVSAHLMRSCPVPVLVMPRGAAAEQGADADAAPGAVTRT